MNKLLIVCGLVMLGATATTEKVEQQVEQKAEVVYTNFIMPTESLESLAEIKVDPFRKTPDFIKVVDSNFEVINLNEINYVDLNEEEDIDLGFDTAQYLPEGFNPYEVYFDINSVEFIDTENTELAFDTAAFLPEDFNPYTAVVDIDGINYIDEEEMEEVKLGFNSAEYLPVGFRPYEVYFNINSITYIEDDELEEVDLGFDTTKYLPDGFDPYAVNEIK